MCVHTSVCLVFMCECMSEIFYTCWTETGTLFYEKLPKLCSSIAVLQNISWLIDLFEIKRARCCGSRDLGSDQWINRQISVEIGKTLVCTL